MEEKTEIKKIKISDKNYPLLLKKIKNPPKVLYFKGEIKNKEKCFAIVGARRCTLYGKEIAFKFAFDLAKLGITIVSGFAPGIDTMAHKGALEAGGRTIAVLGTGLDEKYIYPKSNLKLSREIVKKGGVLISEYPPETSGSRFTFPQRNRIISGLSLGVLVVEAREKSGALITANLAKKQKKKVFAIPGPINSPLSKGCHLLIKEGAILVEKIEDILNELKIEIKKEGKEEKSKTKEEEIILKILEKGALHLDEIIEKTNLPSQKVISLLSFLEIEGKVKNLGGNIFTISS